MRHLIGAVPVMLLLVWLGFISGCSRGEGEIERPERIQSKRLVVYDNDTYDKLATSWEAYYNAFPSEDAYANWMYAARYAGHEYYEDKLAEGLKRYPANPTILYLSGMARQRASDDEEGARMLERATELDPLFIDPWFSLVIHYMRRGDMEEMDVALRHLLEGEAIFDEVFDYSCNMLLGLEENAILITNGDNDTYPGWILTRIVGMRSDVRIVNRSLLKTSWYPIHMIDEGVPRFITNSELEELRQTSKPPFSDELITRIVKAGEREGRPVYFSHTLAPSARLDPVSDKGRVLGLVTLVTTPKHSYADQLRDIEDVWVNEYRTGGMDGWRVRFAGKGDASRVMLWNYPASISRMLGPLKSYAPEYLPALFCWYREHCLPLLSHKEADGIGPMWLEANDVDEIREWCEAQGYTN